MLPVFFWFVQSQERTQTNANNVPKIVRFFLFSLNSSKSLLPISGILISISPKRITEIDDISSTSPRTIQIIPVEIYKGEIIKAKKLKYFKGLLKSNSLTPCSSTKLICSIADCSHINIIRYTSTPIVTIGRSNTANSIIHPTHNASLRSAAVIGVFFQHLVMCYYFEHTSSAPLGKIATVCPMISPISLFPHVLVTTMEPSEFIPSISNSSPIKEFSSSFSSSKRYSVILSSILSTLIQSPIPTSLSFESLVFNINYSSGSFT